MKLRSRSLMGLFVAGEIEIRMSCEGGEVARAGNRAVTMSDGAASVSNGVARVGEELGLG
ncbi:hypothetical protein TIFTF001_052163 [Ficus carica]|uniref:Uncharacterized protein n=1 Tax=Ficus carica TaxID=3494 RepID=A0AA88EFX1_FICCA|nr:hypothetical protein TIFTF001_052160 [Ficus carica]GMN73338.1 hypothetical protein TIFTF001_052161 [Ficus carica]GMN73344.1 hypothetical protein TIFTF001_052162 [Ficus carica]GMN73348.1 hypothetical protein TIFTF001_052163 [Ficus carica]